MGKHKYSNEKITVEWDSEVCIHSAVCVNNLSSVFDLKKKPWVNVDGASVEDITALIDSCPSKALSYKFANQSATESKERKMDLEQVKVTISENGPYLVKGNFSVEDAQGNKVETKETVALCRCGASTNKPFCDGSHRKAEFQG